MLVCLSGIGWHLSSSQEGVESIKSPASLPQKPVHPISDARGVHVPRHLSVDLLPPLRVFFCLLGAPGHLLLINLSPTSLCLRRLRILTYRHLPSTGDVGFVTKTRLAIPTLPGSPKRNGFVFPLASACNLPFGLSRYVQRPRLGLAGSICFSTCRDTPKLPSKWLDIQRGMMEVGSVPPFFSDPIWRSRLDVLEHLS